MIKVYINLGIVSWIEIETEGLQVFTYLTGFVFHFPWDSKETIFGKRKFFRTYRKTISLGEES